jgi:hypothetical protein
MVLEWRLKKMQSGFQDLIKIVRHPNFQPEDVSGTNWQLIDAQLSGDQSCNPSNDEETGRTKRITVIGLKPKSRSRSHSTKGHCIQGKRSST